MLTFEVFGGQVFEGFCLHLKILLKRMDLRFGGFLGSEDFALIFEIFRVTGNFRDYAKDLLTRLQAVVCLRL